MALSLFHGAQTGARGRPRVGSSASCLTEAERETSGALVEVESEMSADVQSSPVSSRKQLLSTRIVALVDAAIERLRV